MHRMGNLGASAQTDGRSGVEIPYVKGLTSHYGPESWGGARKDIAFKR
jgi:hypothetical protein